MTANSVPIGYCDSNPNLSYISTASGGVAFLLSLISQLPQLIETYNDKSVEGVSPYLIGSWLLGDITSVIGAILTHQLPFQILLALYFLSNDLIICMQYYYYGILYQNKLATPGHQHLIHVSKSHPNLQQQNGEEEEGFIIPSQTSSNNRKNIFTKATFAILALFTRSSNLFQLGLILSWFSGMFYFFSRVPQLLKFYKRKSTDGISPYMFYCTIFHNILYALSIFSSCEFIDNSHKLDFFKKELPFLLGSIGTLLWDFIYLYQHLVLYSEDNKIRKELSKLNIVDEDIEVDLENEPLIVSTSNHSNKPNVYTSL
ncbi:hypothetical protein HANVADRAFT_52942 [Hanseniaspora valbyensis NRRL Y-1626]|uniref:PQ-loop-domain-containing protein n=1 Tax=Hanseniaspora valbyensis NRRL Y-1626 TaxID=766949 RepID=A0A1B7TD39_9ASCO|nr:hypothetical protein HANVADRAFT_52942 [Hanseniaspora valbyensis NRRL Y-1626]